MLRTVAFAALCLVLAAYGVFRVSDAYSIFVSDMPDPAGSRQVVKRKIDPIADADAYALSQITPSAGGRKPTPAPAARHSFTAPDEKELLKLLSEPSSKIAPALLNEASTAPAGIANRP